LNVAVVAAAADTMFIRAGAEEVDDAVVVRRVPVVGVVVMVKAQQEEQYLLLMPAAAVSTAHQEKICPACLIVLFGKRNICSQEGNSSRFKTSSKGFERLHPFWSSFACLLKNHAEQFLVAYCWHSETFRHRLAAGLLPSG
jgi:hypothetical protein